MSDPQVHKVEWSVTRFGKRAAARLLENDLVVRMKAAGYQHFVMVVIERPGEEKLCISCKTQNEAGAFAGELAGTPEFSQSRFLQGLERALRDEVYESADLFFEWSKDTQAPVVERVLRGLPAGVLFSAYVGYPIFAVKQGGSSASLEDKVGILDEALRAYSTTSGNDASRLLLIESLALALSRILGAQSEYQAASEFVQRGLERKPYSIYLKAAKHALTLRLEDKKVPDRLQKFIGEDNGHLRQFVCPEPFKRFDIGPSGDVLVCCGHWLPASIGNFVNDSTDSVLNSERALKIRKSMTDGSYKYCNHLECGAMIQGTLPTRDELTDPAIIKAIAEDNYRVQAVEQVLFALDQTCNLSCPSCRKERIIERASESDRKVSAVEDKLKPLLPTLRVLNINPAGELFASKPSRKILELINDESCPDLVLDIISNGTLFSEEEWNKFPGIHTKIRSVRISVDAASRETFENLRRLGKYETFLNNMRFLKRLRLAGTIPQLKISFTYQLENFREMAEFVRFGTSMSCDFIIFERLQNLGTFTHAEYCSKAVHRPEHPLHAEFLSVIRHPIFRQNNVWHEFDYEGIQTLSREDARDRLARALDPVR